MYENKRRATTLQRFAYCEALRILRQNKLVFGYASYNNVAQTQNYLFIRKSRLWSSRELSWDELRKGLEFESSLHLPGYGHQDYGNMSSRIVGLGQEVWALMETKDNTEGDTAADLSTTSNNWSSTAKHDVGTWVKMKFRATRNPDPANPTSTCPRISPSTPWPVILSAPLPLLDSCYATFSRWCTTSRPTLSRLQPLSTLVKTRSKVCLPATF